MADRKVRRVLVMIDYGEGDTANGEVFDLTALVTEMLPHASWRARLGLEVIAEKDRDWSTNPPVEKAKLSIQFSGDAGNWVYGATHLDDVVNSSLPDGERVQSLKKREKLLLKKAEQLRSDAMVAKLQQVAAIRHQHPIARFSEPLPQLPASVTETAPQPEPVTT
jgi:hypothetical protein